MWFHALIGVFNSTNSCQIHHSADEYLKIYLRVLTLMKREGWREVYRLVEEGTL